MQPCSQPRYGLIERSKPMFGESLRAVIVRVESTVKVEVKGPSSSSAVPQPSSNARRLSASKRPLSLLAAPRPLRGLTVAGISMPQGYDGRREHFKNYLVNAAAPPPPADAGPSLSPLSRGEGLNSPSPRWRGE